MTSEPEPIEQPGSGHTSTHSAFGAETQAPTRSNHPDAATAEKGSRNGSGQPVAIVNCAVLDVETGSLNDGPVHILDGTIVGLGSDSIAGSRVIDAQGGTVLPGLIDAHFHAYAVRWTLLDIGALPLSYVALMGAERLGRALRRGFTTVRDPAGGDAGMSRAIDEGLFASPRYLWTGAALSQTGGHGDPRPGDLDMCSDHLHVNEVVDGADNLRRAVRDRFRRGAHAIKIMASGGVVSLTDPIRNPQYSADEIRAVTDEAQRRGSYVAAHAYSAEAVTHAVTNGVRSIEHGNLIDEATADLMAEKGAYLVPTLAAYEANNRRGAELGASPVSMAKNLEVLEHGKVSIELARTAGVPIGFGSDLAGDLESDQLLGLRLQHEVEGTLRTIQAATAVNAALIGHPDLGRVAVGCRADLLILNQNPIDVPSALWSGARTVIRAGCLIE